MSSPPDQPFVVEVVFIGVRRLGKSSVTLETGALRGRRRVKHAVVEGDALDLAWPPLREHGLAERNLEAIMRNYMARVRPAGGLRHGRRQGRYTQAQFLSARQGAGSRDT